MRFVRRSPPRAVASTPAKRGGGSAGNYRGDLLWIPELWKREYIARIPVLALLACGCKENLNDAGILIVARGREESVVCEKCDTLASVARKLDLLEYLGIPVNPLPEHPPF